MSDIQRAKMVYELDKQAMNYEQLIAFTGMSMQAVGRWVRRMKAAGEIHVESWSEDKNGRLFVPMFRWGAKPDAARPGAAITNAQRMAEMRARRKAEGVK